MRTGPYVARLIAVAMVAAGGVVAVPAGVAMAEPGEGRAQNRSTVTFKRQATPGTSRSIKSEYDSAKRDRERGAALRREFTSKAAADGLYYDAGFVDYLKLERNDGARFKTVEMVVPRDYWVDEVEISEGTETDADGTEHGVVEASVKGTMAFDESDVVVPDGPGFASFSPVGSGQYLLKTAVGEMLATWSKSKMTGETNGSYDYWSYQRKARVTTKDLSLSPDYAIRYFGIKSYPFSSTPLHHWVDWSPATGTRTGDCNSTPLNLSLSYLGASTSISFIDCDRYNVAIANSNPGDMSFNWDKGWAGLPKGTREGAFNWIAARTQGGSFFANDFQRVGFYEAFSEDLKECSSTNAGANC